MATSITYRDREISNPIARVVTLMLLVVTGTAVVIIGLVVMPVAYVAIRLGIPGCRFVTPRETRGRGLFGRDAWAITYTFS